MQITIEYDEKSEKTIKKLIHIYEMYCNKLKDNVVSAEQYICDAQRRSVLKEIKKARSAAVLKTIIVTDGEKTTYFNF